MKGTNLVRIRTVKRGTLQTRSRLEVEGISIPDQDKARLSHAMTNFPESEVVAHVGGTKGKYYVEMSFGSDRFRFPVSNVIIERKLDEFPGQDILAVCAAYYSALESVVRKCREKFDA